MHSWPRYIGAPSCELTNKFNHVIGTHCTAAWCDAAEVSHPRERFAVCYTASMRPGRTKTTSFSLDGATLKNLKALAARRHKGNVSALLAEIAGREAKFAAAEAFFEKYGVPPLDDEDIERIEAEWRGEAPKKRRRRAA